MIHIPTLEIETKPQSPFMDKKTIMRTLGIGLSTMNKWLYVDGLQYYKVNRRVFIKTKDFNEWLEQFKLNKPFYNES